jgi:type VI secretion system protein ImpA
MQVIDIGIDWESPISEAMPAGPDMQYSQEFAELEAAAAVTPEQQYGSVVISAKAPEWRDVLDKAVALSKQTRDLRVLLLMSRALVWIHGLVGLKVGLDALGSLLEHQWEQVHPQLVVDGVQDPQLRFGVLSEFAATEGLVGDMRQATALDTRLGALSVRDLERVVEHGHVEINGIDIGRQQIDQMVSELEQSQTAALELPGQLAHRLDQVRQSIETRLGVEYTPDLTLLMRPLERVSRLLQGGKKVNAESETGESPVLVGEAGVLNAPSTLNSRDAVVKAMDAICAYLERHEPTNPAQLLVRRARKLMGMGFLDIVKEMSPDGVNQVMFIVGAENAEDNNS